MKYEPVIGLEIHAELATETKMFCSCRVVDTTQAAPNTTVCPVCAGMPGTLPVVNRKAVEYGIRVALALDCQVQHTSIFARKNYFYPDLPKGYQISQYEDPLAVNGRLVVETPEGEHTIRVRRVHLEEDTGKLTHVHDNGEDYSLVDLNRAGVPLLEIVSEPDMHSIEDVRGYATGLRSIVRELGVNSGDMEKGVIRFEANISLRPMGSQELGTRVEIKNLNSFRAMERAILFEIERQSRLLDAGEAVQQETLGWDETNQVTYSQRSKEEAHDYRYFPEPDLPPLVVEEDWVHRVRETLPELPQAKIMRFSQDYGLNRMEAGFLVNDGAAAEYFEAAVKHLKTVAARTVFAWLTGEIFAWMNQNSIPLSQVKVTPAQLAELIETVQSGRINQNTGKSVLTEMLNSGRTAEEIIEAKGLAQVSDSDAIGNLVRKVLAEHPAEIESYRSGKVTLSNWFFGQVMRVAGGKANPAVLRDELTRQLKELQ
ncbi:MAG: Asp-tRNA(Asn)/Glu-tRNA(Gln) amidotransferase subunit GatB [Anaerolineaceae bacterium]|jgi:aspartyl-tRNA(Asn)/glutamyl-tRNA(Gln) amidotransferase subunit B